MHRKSDHRTEYKKKGNENHEGAKQRGNSLLLSPNKYPSSLSWKCCWWSLDAWGAFLDPPHNVGRVHVLWVISAWAEHPSPEGHGHRCQHLLLLFAVKLAGTLHSFCTDGQKREKRKTNQSSWLSCGHPLLTQPLLQQFSAPQIWLGSALPSDTH